MTAWDKDVLLKELKSHHVTPEQVDFLVCTHGHSDHCGNMNLFLNAYHFLGSCVSHRHLYYYHDFEKNPYKLDTNIEVVPTAGHTSTCVSVIVQNTNHGGTVAIVGDLFEKEEDIFDETLWIEAGTEDEKLQRKNRLQIAEKVDYIIPGHGGRFAVTEEMRQKLREDAAKL
jgi:glyoxylase-like metal-dependent hydrolase (beta-lactamase superfamily II)